MAAGIALGLVSKSTTIDALVMASAALRGDTVYTSDVGDLELGRHSSSASPHHSASASSTASKGGARTLSRSPKTPTSSQ
jgi:hypothetical protein